MSGRMAGLYVDVPMTAHAIYLTSLDELRLAAGPWDDLWRRSNTTSPTLRATLITQWVECFEKAFSCNTPSGSFRALVVEQGGRWVAGLPLVARRGRGPLSIGVLPANEWSDSGDLLLDPNADAPPVLDVLADAFHLLPWPLLRFSDIAIEADHWQQALAALQRAQLPLQFRPEMSPGRIDTSGDWGTCRQGWSRRHRQQMARHERALAARGRVELQVLDQLGPDEVEPWLSIGFDIENRSWKGARGTSVLRSPGMFAFYLGQARALARYGELELALLKLDDRPIAFAYGMCAKGVYRSYKVGYDPEFAPFSPGQLLRYRLLERFFRDERYRGVEYITPTPAHLRWRPELYPIGRLLVGQRTWLGRCLVAAGSLLPAR